jgi:hypothetical protein
VDSRELINYSVAFNQWYFKGKLPKYYTPVIVMASQSILDENPAYWAAIGAANMMLINWHPSNYYTQFSKCWGLSIADSRS